MVEGEEELLEGVVEEEVEPKEGEIPEQQLPARTTTRLELPKSLELMYMTMVPELLLTR